MAGKIKRCIVKKPKPKSWKQELGRAGVTVNILSNPVRKKILNTPSDREIHFGGIFYSWKQGDYFSNLPVSKKFNLNNKKIYIIERNKRGEMKRIIDAKSGKLIAIRSPKDVWLKPKFK